MDTEDNITAPSSRTFAKARKRFALPLVAPERSDVLIADLPASAKGAVLFLAEALTLEFVRPPLIGAKNRREYFGMVSERWHEYTETLDALHTFLARARTEEGAFQIAERSIDSALSFIGRSIAEIAGEPGAEEIDFAAQTFRRAVTLARRLSMRPIAADSPAKARDEECCVSFQNAAAMYSLSLTSFFEIARGLQPAPDVLVGVFEILRAGSLEAYQYAREALDLRPSEEEDAQPLLTAADEDDDLIDVGLDEAEELIQQSEQLIEDG